jgi:RNA polymerase sigma factor (sigma-70 family)
VGYSNKEINDLLEGCKNNQRISQHKFYDWLKSYAVQICFRYSSNHQDIEDLVSEGFIKVFKKIHLYDGDLYGFDEHTFKGWFKKVIINNCIDKLRKKQLLVEFHPHMNVVVVNDNTATTFDKLNYKDIIDSISELSPMYKTVFNLFVIEGMSHEEISQVLGISIGTSKSNLFKAKENLRTIFLKNKISKYA